MNFSDMVEPMHPGQRIFRLAVFFAVPAWGYWMAGWTGAFSAWVVYCFIFWIWTLANGTYKALKRDFGNDGRPATFQIDQKVLNMSVEKGSAIKGTPFDFTEHRDPTRPGREISS